MKARLGLSGDIGMVLDLQEKNLVSNLTAEQMKDGFVTTPFTDAQLLNLVKIDGLFVLEEENSIIGYTMAAGWDYFKGRAMFDYMIERFVGLSYRGEIITYENSFQYGPVCIAAERRGTSAFPILFDRMKDEMFVEFKVGTTFINKINARSLEAHMKKVKMEIIDEFEFNNNSYYGLGCLYK